VAAAEASVTSRPFKHIEALPQLAVQSAYTASLPHSLDKHPPHQLVIARKTRRIIWERHVFGWLQECAPVRDHCEPRINNVSSGAMNMGWRTCRINDCGVLREWH